MTQLYLISPPTFELRDFSKQLKAALSYRSPLGGEHARSSHAEARRAKAGADQAVGGKIQQSTPHDSSTIASDLDSSAPPQGGSGNFIGAFQLRLKGTDDAQIKLAINELMPICRAHEVAFIINDRVDLCVELGCDGVHVGQEDLEVYSSPHVWEQTRPSAKRDGQVVGGKTPTHIPPTLQASSDEPLSAAPPQGGSENIEYIRTQLDDDMVLGITCHASKHLAMEAAEAGADYVAFGAFYPTTSKPKEKLEKWGTPTPDMIEWWTTYTEIPCVAIGGITPENCMPLVKAGADFIAVITAVWEHPNGAAEAVREFYKACNSI